MLQQDVDALRKNAGVIGTRTLIVLGSRRLGGAGGAICTGWVG